MAEEPSLAPQWLKSGITAAGTAHSRPDEGGETGGRPAAVPSARLSTDGPSRDSFTGRRSSDWSGKASQAVGQVPQPSWDKPSLRAHHRGGAHRNIFEDHASDIFGPSTGGAGKHLHPHHHRAGPSTPSSPYRHNKDTPKDFAKEPEKDYGGAWGVGSHQNSTGPRSAATRPLNVRGPALNGANSDGKAAARGPNQQHQIGLEKDYLPGPKAGLGVGGQKDFPQPLSPGGPTPLEAVYTRLADTPGSPHRPFSPQPTSPSPLTSPADISRLQVQIPTPDAPCPPATPISALPLPHTSPCAEGTAVGSSAPGSFKSASSAAAGTAAVFSRRADPPTPIASAASVPITPTAARSSAPTPSKPTAASKPAAEASIPQRLGGWAVGAGHGGQDRSAAAATQKEPSAAPTRSGQAPRGWAGVPAIATGAAASTAASAIPQATPGAATGPTPTPAASSAPAPVTRMADAITQQQMSSAAAMQQVASERQREEKLLARQAKLIPVAFSGPRPRLGGTSHPGDRSQGSKPSALTGLGPAASSKAMLGAPRGSGPESRGIAAPLAAGARRSGVPEDVPVSSGPTTLTLSHSLPMSDKLGSNGTQGSLARALSDVERNARQPLLSPSKSGPTQTGLGSAAAAAAAVKPPGTPTGLQNKAKERNTFFQSLRRARAPASTSERPSSSSSLSPASSLDAPSLATSGRAETADAPGLSSLSEVVQEQLGGKHTAQNGFHDKAAALKGQCEAHGSTPEEAALLDMLGMTVEELAFMRRLGWTPKPASSMEAEGLTEEEIRSFKEQQQAQPSKAKLPPSAVPAGASIRPRSAPYPCPPLSPWRSANGNGFIHLATLDVGSYGSKLSDSDSDPE